MVHLVAWNGGLQGLGEGGSDGGLLGLVGRGNPAGGVMKRGMEKKAPQPWDFEGQTTQSAGREEEEG